MSGKNIIVVTASMGAGHNKAAKAVAEAIKRKYPLNKVKVTDFMSSKTAHLNSFVKDVYLKMLDYVPNLYEFFYNFTAAPTKTNATQAVFARAMKKDMRTLAEKYRADMIICTHPFPCAAASALKQSGDIDIPLATVMTDFCMHQFWISKHTDIYFTASDELKQALVSEGVSENKIFSTGIPIGYSFRLEQDKKALMQKFKLDDSLPVILMMGGGLGMGGVKNALMQIEKLKQQLQILVVTGANVSLWSEISEYAQHSKHKISVWGYSHNIQELMAVSTFLISKPGALTISEALAMNLPMVLHNPIPGPEADNAKFVADNGAAVWVKHEDTIDAVVRELLSDATILPQLRKNSQKLSRPYAADDLADTIAARFGLE